jgi:hypothetical protein
MCHTPIDIRATGALSQQFDDEIPLLLLEQLEPFFSNLTMKYTPQIRGRHVRLMLSDQVLTRWR